jgi:hypothetical protein
MIDVASLLQSGYSLLKDVMFMSIAKERLR